MAGTTLGERAQRTALLGYAMGMPGAVLLGLFFFFLGFASGWGRDSIGAGIVIAIFAPAAFLGAIALSTLLSACAVLSKSKIIFVCFFMFSVVFAVLLLFLYFSYFIPFVYEATGSSRAWQGHRLPAWWKSASNLIGILSLVFILSSIGLSIRGLMSRPQKGNHQDKSSDGST